MTKYIYNTGRWILVAVMIILFFYNGEPTAATVALFGWFICVRLENILERMEK